MKLPKNEEDEMSSIAVLIPCYNESVTIKKVIEDYKKALPEATIYVYDNNSSTFIFSGKLTSSFGR